MSNAEIVVTVPEELANDAKEFGTLDSEVILSLLRTETDRRIMDFVNSEIQAHREEKAGKERGGDNKLE